MIDATTRDQVACKLFMREAIERQVVVECVNDVVAVRRGMMVLVAVVTYCVGKANEIEPVNSHPLAEMLAREIAVDHTLILTGIAASHKPLNILGRRRQAEEVE